MKATNIAVLVLLAAALALSASCRSDSDVGAETVADAAAGVGGLPTAESSDPSEPTSLPSGEGGAFASAGGATSEGGAGGIGGTPPPSGGGTAGIVLMGGGGMLGAMDSGGPPACPPGQAWCFVACIDVRADINNCGGCLQQCEVYEYCSNGTCMSPPLSTACERRRNTSVCSPGFTSYGYQYICEPHETTPAGVACDYVGVQSGLTVWCCYQ